MKKVFCIFGILFYLITFSATEKVFLQDKYVEVEDYLMGIFILSIYVVGLHILIRLTLYPHVWLSLEQKNLVSKCIDGSGAERLSMAFIALAYIGLVLSFFTMLPFPEKTEKMVIPISLSTVLILLLMGHITKLREYCKKFVDEKVRSELMDTP